MICLESSASSGMSCIAWRSDCAALVSAASSALASVPCAPSWLVVWLWPASVTSCGASGASCWMTSFEPVLFDPSELSDAPPRMPPEPLVVSETEAGAK